MERIQEYRNAINVLMLLKRDNPTCVATCPGGAIGFEIVDQSVKSRFEKEMAGYFI